MKVKRIAFGWIKNALDEIPPGEWILIADGKIDYYNWFIAQGSQKDVEEAYLKQGGAIALTFRITDGKAMMLRPEQAICPRCKVRTNKEFIGSGVCRECEKKAL